MSARVGGGMNMWKDMGNVMGGSAPFSALRHTLTHTPTLSLAHTHSPASACLMDAGNVMRGSAPLSALRSSLTHAYTHTHAHTHTHTQSAMNASSFSSLASPERVLQERSSPPLPPHSFPPLRPPSLSLLALTLSLSRSLALFFVRSISRSLSVARVLCLARARSLVFSFSFFFSLSPLPTPSPPPPSSLLVIPLGESHSSKRLNTRDSDES